MVRGLERSKDDLAEQVKILQNSLEEMRNNKQAMIKNYQDQIDEQRISHEEEIESIKAWANNTTDQIENTTNSMN